MGGTASRDVKGNDGTATEEDERAVFQRFTRECCAPTKDGYVDTQLLNLAWNASAPAGRRRKVPAILHAESLGYDVYQEPWNDKAVVLGLSLARWPAGKRDGVTTSSFCLQQRPFLTGQN